MMQRCVNWLAAPAALPHQAPQPPLGRVPALDALRGAAILAVTLYRFHGPPNDDSLAGQALETIARCGVRGVDLFFVLSGFLITGILYDGRDESGSLGRFYVRRSLRIFPLYYASLLVLLILLPLISTPAATLFSSARDQQWWFWLYGVNVYQSWHGAWPFGPLDHFWSLAIEEHFYLVWPFVIVYLSRGAALRVCATLIVAALAGRMAWVWWGGNAVAPEVFTLFRLDALAAGSMLALWLRRGRGWGWIVRAAPWCLTLLAPLVIAITVAQKRLLTIPDSLVVMICGSLLILALASPRESLWGRLGQSRLLRFYGKYSYAMYVFQNPLIPLMAPLLSIELLAARTGSLFIGRLLYIVLMTAITTLLAWISWHSFEKHLLAWRDRFAPHERQAARDGNGDHPRDAGSDPQGSSCSSCSSPAISAAASQRFS